NYLLNQEWVSFNFEQGKTSLFDKVLCRKPVALADVIVSEVERKTFDCFFLIDAIPTDDSCIVFWGCDYIALNCEKEEIEAVIKISAIGKVVYRQHPRINLNENAKLCSFVVNIEEPCHFKKHATLASGAITAELGANHSVLLFLNPSVEMSKTLAGFYGVRGQGVLNVFNFENITLSKLL
ncbi:hypothetical protein N8878_02720, partial [Psychromonas sp.]|nr:hypothetical protein [Psychromonas sp.]